MASAVRPVGTLSQIRGLLLDRGIAFPKSITRARRMIPEILTDEENELTALAREAIGELHDLFRNLDRRIASFDKKIERVFRASEDCQRIAHIKGVGPKKVTRVDRGSEAERRDAKPDLRVIYLTRSHRYLGR